MSNQEPPNLGAVVTMFMMIFGIMVFLHDLSESVATDVVRHNSVSFLCPQR
jgi:hypothetical protein